MAASSQRIVCQIFTPVGMLGYGFDEEEMHHTLSTLTSSSNAPTAIICDSGSTDSGPKKLATGDMACPRMSYKRDLDRLLGAVRKYSIPLLIGSAGGAGMDSQVDELTAVIGEICEERGFDASIVQIFSEIDKSLVHARLAKGLISGCSSAVPNLLSQDIDESNVLVAQMGPEPYVAALAKCPEAQVILGGRAYDPAPYVAFAQASMEKLNPGYHQWNSEKKARVEGGFMHARKIMECGGLCAKPKSHGSVAILYEDGSFDIRPTLPEARCTPASVAAHTLYEKSRPDILYGPGGWLDVTKSTYEALQGGTTVRVRGSTFAFSVDNKLPYQVKLEGAREKGFRSMYMGSINDPILVAQIDNLLVRIKQYVKSQHVSLDDKSWDLDWHVYGRGDPTNPTSGLFLVGETRASSQALARSLANSARVATIHAPYSGQKATGGNFGFGLGGLTEVDLGPCSEFCVYHLMDTEAGEETSLFKSKVVHLEGRSQKANGTPQASDVQESNNGKPTGPRDAQKHSPPQQVSPGYTDTTTLGGIASIVRSKNAGPYEITFDIVFDKKELYEAVKASELLTVSKVAELYDLHADEVIWSGFFDPALSFKATIPRKRNGKAVPSGGHLEDDVHGSQKHLPLLLLNLPEALQKFAELHLT